MNYYPHHIGDFNNATRHLTRLERSIYRDMIDMYYDSEQPLPLDRAVLCRKLMARSEEESTAVEQVLNEFFTETGQGWMHARCEAEIEAYHKKLKGKSEAGKASAAARAAKSNKPKAAPSNDSEQSATGAQQVLTSCSTNQEPITSNQEPSTASVAGAQALQCPVQQIIDAYHELMPLNPKVKVLNDARRKAIKARWNEASMLTFQPFGYANSSDGLQAWRRFFEICSDSKFLTGRAPGMPGKPPFVADIDFLLSPQGFAKVLENKYHRDAA